MYKRQTWTEEEFRTALDADAYPVLAMHLLHPRGSMHHDPAKKVLSLVQNPEEIARSLGRPVDEIRSIIARGKASLLEARARREAPFIDRTLYTSLNGMLISAYFHAFAVLGDQEIRAFAVKSLERILKERIVNGRLMHSADIAAAFDDFIHIIDALVSGYEATAEPRYIKTAEDLMAACLEAFYDRDNGGFFDTEGEVLGSRLKKVEDVPHPSDNAAAILVLLRLAEITGNDEYRRYAEQSLKLFAAFAREINVHAGAYFSGLDASFRMVKLTVEARPDSGLARAARALSGRMSATIVYGDDNNRVIPCKNRMCYEPISDPASIIDICVKL